MNPLLIALARRTGTPLVATNDCHYLNPGDDKLQEILLCLQTGKTISDPTRMRFGSDQFYVKTAEEFERAFGHAAPDALANTLAIAERCNVKIELGVNKIPEIALPPGVTADGKLREMATAGLERRLEERCEAGGGAAAGARRGVRRRLDVRALRHREDRVRQLLPDRRRLHRLGEGRKDPGGAGPRQRGGEPGRVLRPDHRGRSDPVQAPLRAVPEPGAGEPPRHRLRLLQEPARRGDRLRPATSTGEENVAQLITFGTWKPRAAVRDVGRVLEMPYAEVDRIAKMIPADLKMTVERRAEGGAALPGNDRREPEDRRPLPHSPGRSRGAIAPRRDPRLGGGDRQPADHRLLPPVPAGHRRDHDAVRDGADRAGRARQVRLPRPADADRHRRHAEAPQGAAGDRDRPRTPWSSPTRKRTRCWGAATRWGSSRRRARGSRSSSRTSSPTSSTT